MARKMFEISFNIAGRLANTFTGSFASASSQMRGLGNQAKTLKKELSGLEADYKKGAVAAGAYQAAHQRMTAQLEKTLQVQQKLRDVTQRQTELQNNASQVRGQMFDTAVAAAPFVASAQAAMQFEDAMLGVARQVQGARDESGKLTQVYYDMGKQIQQLGREIPLATNEIADMVTAGARMGVAREELIGFTRTAAMMATAFDAPAGELAEKMGKVATNFKIPITGVQGLADAINYLDDNAISKGGDIIEVLNRISGTAQQVGMSSKDAAALASTFLTTGSSAEVAATAANAMMRELAIATKQPARFQDGLEALGLTASKIQSGMAKDATGTIQKVLTAINKLPKEQQTAVTVQLFGKEYGDDAARLSQNIGEFRRQLALANGEAAKGSMGREFAARLQTSSAQMQMMKNSATEAAVALGQVLLPGLNQVFKGVSEAAQGAAAFAEKYPNLTKVIVMGTAAVIGARLAWLALKFSWTQAALVGNGLKSLFIKQAAAQTAATTASVIAAGATQRMTIAQRLLNLTMMMNPIGLVITAIGALVAAGIYLYNNWDEAKAKAMQLWETLKSNPMLALAAGPFGALLQAGIALYNNWDRLEQGAMDIGINISNYFKGMANGVIQSINKISSGINEVAKTSIPQIAEMQLDYSVQARKIAESRQARNLGEIPAYANGTIVTRPHVGLFGEAGPEAIIPLKKSDRSLSLWKQTGEALGVSSSGGTVINLTYAPQINGGSASENKEILREDKNSLMDHLKAIGRQERRVQFA